MLFLLFTLMFQLWVENMQAQKFRTDYQWADSTGSFYRLHDFATDWATARRICEAEGTQLLIPDTIEEIESLKVYISNMKSYFEAIFIGIHDIFSTGDFVTVTGKPLLDLHYCEQNSLSSFWIHGTPDNAKGQEHCVVMTRQGLIDDRPCDDVYPFTCKIYGNATKYNKPCNNFDMEYNKSNATGKCYKFHNEPLSWHDAYMVCGAEQSQLLIISSEEEVRVITDQFSRMQGIVMLPKSDILLIGFSDLMFPFDYRTIRGETLQEAGWNMTLSPVSESYSEMLSKRCGAINRAGELVMTSCDEPAMFVCEAVPNDFDDKTYLTMRSLISDFADKFANL